MAALTAGLPRVMYGPTVLTSTSPLADEVTDAVRPGGVGLGDLQAPRAARPAPPAEPGRGRPVPAWPRRRPSPRRPAGRCSRYPRTARPAGPRGLGRGRPGQPLQSPPPSPKRKPTTMVDGGAATDGASPAGGFWRTTRPACWGRRRRPAAGSPGGRRLPARPGHPRARAADHVGDLHLGRLRLGGGRGGWSAARWWWAAAEVLGAGRSRSGGRSSRPPAPLVAVGRVGADSSSGGAVDQPRDR